MESALGVAPLDPWLLAMASSHASIAARNSGSDSYQVARLARSKSRTGREPPTEFRRTGGRRRLALCDALQRADGLFLIRDPDRGAMLEMAPADGERIGDIRQRRAVRLL